MPLTDDQKKAIYEQVVALIRDEIDEPFVVNDAGANNLSVDTSRKISINGRTPKPLNLLSVIIQKQHIGFYFMPVYIEPEMKEDLPDDLAKMLKGKSCFHIKGMLDEDKEQKFRALIRDGVARYRANDWV